ncbi:hypothetical protein OW763_08370 [Clostridium aestuarii]|uniref:S-layer protein n=1 Tax=Clostridium aestuarii TaxID=338193 RepID=A0ABT4D255_9CLOT|nr:hypothetical protein [Clostridium aestuarii]MCY6484370.1 hypothetical protein [Clostridium aestuarii]
MKKGKLKALIALVTATTVTMGLTINAFAMVDGYIVKDTKSNVTYQYNKDKLVDAFLSEKEGEKLLFKDFSNNVKEHGIYGYHDDSEKYVDYQDVANAFLDADEKKEKFDFNKTIEKAKKLEKSPDYVYEREIKDGKVVDVMNIVKDDVTLDFKDKEIKMDVKVTGNNVTLKNAKIKGSLIIDTVKDGKVYIDDVQADTIKTISGSYKKVSYVSGGGSSHSSHNHNDVVTTATVSTIKQLQSAASNSNIKDITIAGNIGSGENINFNRSVNIISNGEYNLKANIEIDTMSASNVNIGNKYHKLTIDGSLSVKAPKATVNNNADVKGKIQVKDVSNSTWNQNGLASSQFVFEDPNGGSLNISKDADLKDGIRIEPSADSIHPVVLKGSINVPITVGSANGNKPSVQIDSSAQMGEKAGIEIKANGTVLDIKAPLKAAVKVEAVVDNLEVSTPITLVVDENGIIGKLKAGEDSSIKFEDSNGDSLTVDEIANLVLDVDENTKIDGVDNGALKVAINTKNTERKVVIDAINAAESNEIEKLLSDNQGILKINLTDYNKLNHKNKVNEKLVGKDFKAITEIKVAFEKAVEEQKAIEEKEEKPVSDFVKEILSSENINNINKIQKYISIKDYNSSNKSIEIEINSEKEDGTVVGLFNRINELNDKYNLISVKNILDKNDDIDKIIADIQEVSKLTLTNSQKDKIKAASEMYSNLKGYKSEYQNDIEDFKEEAIKVLEKKGYNNTADNLKEEGIFAAFIKAIRGKDYDTLASELKPDDGVYNIPEDLKLKISGQELTKVTIGDTTVYDSKENKIDIENVKDAFGVDSIKDMNLSQIKGKRITIEFSNEEKFEIGVNN